jgi:cytochrome c peroxidase
MLPAKVELGRYLFYDLRLSANGKGSCSTCHMQQFGFTDQRPVAVGVTGQSHPRRVMPLANVAWFAVFNWANPTVTQLEDQSVTPLFNDHPIELGLLQQNDRFLQVIATDPTYRRLFPSAFPGDSGPYTFVHVRKALAAFERTLISGNSPYDHYRYRHEEKQLTMGTALNFKTTAFTTSRGNSPFPQTTSAFMSSPATPPTWGNSALPRCAM